MPINVICMSTNSVNNLIYMTYKNKTNEMYITILYHFIIFFFKNAHKNISLIALQVAIILVFINYLKLFTNSYMSQTHKHITVELNTTKLMSLI